MYIVVLSKTENDINVSFRQNSHYGRTAGVSETALR